jgi:hypothetical protein
LLTARPSQGPSGKGEEGAGWRETDSRERKRRGERGREERGERERERERGRERAREEDVFVGVLGGAQVSNLTEWWKTKKCHQKHF